MILRYPVDYIMVVEYFEEGIHNGMDLGWSTYRENEEDIFAPGDGEVVSVRNDYNQTDSSGGSYGNYVKIKHSDNFYSLVAHLKYQSIIVNVGDKVSRGQKLGIMGKTGHAYGVHVHYEVFIDGKKVNPILYTYVFPNQSVSPNPKYSKDLLYYHEEDKDINTLKKMIEELEKENRSLSEQNSILEEENKKLKELVDKYNNIIFKYDINKTSLYLIKMYKGETLLINTNKNEK